MMRSSPAPSRKKKTNKVQILEESEMPQAESMELRRLAHVAVTTTDQENRALPDAGRRQHPRTEDTNRVARGACGIVKKKEP